MISVKYKYTLKFSLGKLPINFKLSSLMVTFIVTALTSLPPRHHPYRTLPNDNETI